MSETNTNTLTMFRNIGNRFRRPGADAADDPSNGGAPPSSTFASAPATMAATVDSAKSFATSLLSGKRPAAAGLDSLPDAEAPDLYSEDRPLGLSIHSLEHVRSALRHLCACANDHATHLVSSAAAQRALGVALADAVRAPDAPDGASPLGPDFGDLAVGASARSAAPDENGAPAVPHFAAGLPPEAVEAQTALGEALANHSQVVVKLSQALTAPINGLASSFEDRYARKIVPLRRRYADQKGQYLKCRRNADMAETEERRSYFEALADAAKPVWLRTSAELRAEAEVMTSLTASKMALWSRSLAKQNERALALAAANFADAFSRANQLASTS